MAKGKEDPPNLCSKFMYAGKYLDDCVSKVNEQITKSFIRDYRRVLENIAEQAIAERGNEQSVSKPHWYQRPVGIVVLGLIVTIVGGLAVLKLSGQW
jgi:hypothetical protein